MKTTLEEIMGALSRCGDDTQLKSGVLAGFVIRTHADPLQSRVFDAMDAAAVLHWFDADLLRRVLGISPDDANERFEALKGFSFVERYGGSQDEIRNVHENTRLGWRRLMLQERPARFRELSAMAASLYASEADPYLQVEWIFHLLSGSPNEGATELEKLDRAWSGGARPEHRASMARALRELLDGRFLAGRAMAWALMVVAWEQISRGEDSADAVGVAAETAMKLAQDTGDTRAEADAWCLKGDWLDARGKTADANVAFRECLKISRRLAELDPGNAGWQRELAVAHGRMGGVLESQGNLTGALESFGEYLKISRRLAELDPGNAGWQRELAVAHSRVGGVLESQGNLTGALESFGEYLKIFRRLAELDPGNAGWQRELAVAHNRVGGVMKSQGILTGALESFGEALKISRRLAEIDPGHAGWQRELAVGLSWLAHVLEKQGRPADALPFREESVRQMKRTVEMAPAVARWGHELEQLEARLAACRARVAGGNGGNPRSS